MKETKNEELAKLIDERYTAREQQEKGKTRVTELIYSNTHWAKNERADRQKPERSYLNTYYHDVLKDVVSEIYLERGYIPYKEGFLVTKKLKGHCDILLYNFGLSGTQKVTAVPHAIVEVKNYRFFSVHNTNKTLFDEQCLMYCALSKINRYILIIRNENVTNVTEYDLDKSDFDKAWDLIRERLKAKRNEN